MSDNAVVNLFESNVVAPFDPRLTKERLATASAVAARSAKMADWPLLEKAIAFKIDEQRKFVAWWDETIGKRQSPGRGGVKSIAGLQSISAADVKADKGIRPDTVSRWRKSLEKPDKYADAIFSAACVAAGIQPPENHRAQGTGENEWFTPPEYIAAARKVMGSISLDPATHPKAQETVQADEFYTKEDDGLTKQWHGNVWLNPPYAQPAIGQFVNKMVEEYAAERVSEAIMLTHNYTDTAWFHAAAAGASMICFTKGRIRFVDVDGDPCAPTQGQAFFYFGNDTAAFAAAFAPFGLIMVPCQ